MKVFITGVSGLLGSTMARFLINQGDEVVGIDNMIGGVEGNVPELVTYIKGDITDQNLKIKHQYDIIFTKDTFEHI